MLCEDFQQKVIACKMQKYLSTSKFVCRVLRGQFISFDGITHQNLWLQDRPPCVSHGMEYRPTPGGRLKELRVPTSDDSLGLVFYLLSTYKFLTWNPAKLELYQLFPQELMNRLSFTLRLTWWGQWNIGLRWNGHVARLLNCTKFMALRTS